MCIHFKNSVLKTYFLKDIFQNLTDRVGNTLELPTRDDLKGAAAALIRLQATYDLDASDLADGFSRENVYKK